MLACARPRMLTVVHLTWIYIHRDTGQPFFTEIFTFIGHSVGKLVLMSWGFSSPIFLFPISVSVEGNSYFLSLVFVSDELVVKIVSVTDNWHLETCQGSQVISECSLSNAFSSGLAFKCFIYAELWLSPSLGFFRVINKWCIFPLSANWQHLSWQEGETGLTSVATLQIDLSVWLRQILSLNGEMPQCLSWQHEEVDWTWV